MFSHMFSHISRHMSGHISRHTSRHISRHTPGRGRRDQAKRSACPSPWRRGSATGPCRSYAARGSPPVRALLACLLTPSYGLRLGEGPALLLSQLRAWTTRGGVTRAQSRVCFNSKCRFQITGSLILGATTRKYVTIVD